MGLNDIDLTDHLTSLPPVTSLLGAYDFIYHHYDILRVVLFRYRIMYVRILSAYDAGMVAQMQGYTYMRFMSVAKSTSKDPSVMVAHMERNCFITTTQCLIVNMI